MDLYFQYVKSEDHGDNSPVKVSGLEASLWAVWSAIVGSFYRGFWLLSIK